MPRMKIGTPFLYDDVTGDIIGLKDEDGSEKTFIWDGDFNGAAPEAGTLTGAEFATVSRGSGVLKTTLTAIGEWVLKTYQGYTAPFIGAVPRAQHDKNAESPSAYDAGAVIDGIADDAPKLQALFDGYAGGTLLLPYGTYYLGSDITIRAKAAPGSSGPQGAMKIRGNGAKFIGPGRLIIDSCKRLRLRGIDAPATDLVLRGCWYSDFSGLRMRDIILGDATGVQFSSNYWDKFSDCQFQSIITHATGTQGNNKIDWVGCQFRGDASQGFSSTRAYFLNFYANQDAQSWSFTGCDVSYYTTDMIYVDGGATEDISLKFADCYFDSKIPTGLARAKFRMITDNCHVANDIPTSAKISQLTHGPQDGWRGDRAAGYQSWTAYNLIPNGDFSDVLATYVGTNLPVGSANSATVTGMTGAGINGNYIKIDQALTASNQVRLRPIAAPMAGRYTAVVVLRNGVAGSKILRYSMFGLFYNVTLTDAEWSIITLTSGSDVAAGTVNDIQLLTDDGTGFNVDVCYCGTFLGEAPPLFLPSRRPQQLNASITYDAGNLSAGQQTTQNVTVPGAALGDFCLASLGVPAQGLTVTAYATGTDTVQVLLYNGSGSSKDLASTTLRVRVFKNSY